MEITKKELLRRMDLAKFAKERHMKSPFCEHPRSCGGCHFYSGYIECIRELMSGEIPKDFNEIHDVAKQQ